MANKPIHMLKLRQVLRYYTQGTSKKQISVITGIARNTVKRYIGRFISLHLTYEDVAIFVWPFSREGDALAGYVADKVKLPLRKREWKLNQK